MFLSSVSLPSLLPHASHPSLTPLSILLHSSLTLFTLLTLHIATFEAGCSREFQYSLCCIFHEIIPSFLLKHLRLPQVSLRISNIIKQDCLSFGPLGGWRITHRLDSVVLSETCVRDCSTPITSNPFYIYSDTKYINKLYMSESVTRLQI